MARFCDSTPRTRIIHHKIDVITENCSSKTIKTDLDLVSRKLTRILCPGGLRCLQPSREFLLHFIISVPGPACSNLLIYTISSE